ncbi:MAG TPA: methylmalonyl-CoA epimerase [Gemmatimonadales bacterium]|jgi:methylmalonyl-CoA/ethylmalonyl-CoA epimerase
MLPPDVAARSRLAHVGLAVRDLDEALRFYRDILGVTPHPSETADGATIVGLSIGGTEIELLSATDAESPIGKYLARHGPGIHHVCFAVPDLDAALERCREAGFQLIDQVPRAGADGRRVAFLHPKATAGILVELTG